MTSFWVCVLVLVLDLDLSAATKSKTKTLLGLDIFLGLLLKSGLFLGTFGVSPTGITSPRTCLIISVSHARRCDAVAAIAAALFPLTLVIG